MRQGNCPDCDGYGTVEVWNTMPSEARVPKFQYVDCKTCRGTGNLTPRDKWGRG